MPRKRISFIFLFSLIFIVGTIYTNSIMPYPHAELQPLEDFSNLSQITSKMVSIEIAALPYLFVSLAFCLFFSCSTAFMFYGSIKKGGHYGVFLWFAINIILAFYRINTFKLIPAVNPKNYLMLVSIIFFVSFTIYIVKLFWDTSRFLKQNLSNYPPPDILFLFLPASFLYLYSFLYSLWVTNYLNFITEMIIFSIVVLSYYYKKQLKENKLFCLIKQFVQNKILPIALSEYFFIIFILILAFVPRVITSYGIFIGTEDNLGGPDGNNFHPEVLHVIGNLSRIFSQSVVWPKPGVDIFLIPIYSVFGPNPTIARHFLIAMGVVSCVLTYFIGKKMFNNKVGMLAAYFHAGYNYLISNETWIGTEGIAIILIEIFVLIILTIQENKFNNKKQSLLMYFAGLCLGYTIFTRPEYLFFPFFFIWWLYLYKKDTIYSAFVSFLSGVFSILMPWIVRNYIAYGNFYVFYNPAYQGDISNEFQAIGINVTSFSKSIIAILSNFPQFIHAIIFSETMHSNVLKFLYWNQYHPYNPSDFIFFRFGTLFYFLGHFFLSMFTIVGLVICLKKFSQRGAIIVFFITYKIFITYFTSYRHWYRATIEPYLLLLASLGIITYFMHILVRKNDSIE